MSEEGHTPPSGEAAWKAAKERIAKNNEAAYARGRKERAAENAAIAGRRLAAERQDLANRPKQPERHA